MVVGRLLSGNFSGAMFQGVSAFECPQFAGEMNAFVWNNKVQIVESLRTKELPADCRCIFFFMHIKSLAMYLESGYCCQT